MSRERVLVANSAQLQIEYATRLLKDAVGNLNSLVHGVGPALVAAKQAITSAEIAHKRVLEMLARVPD